MGRPIQGIEDRAVKNAIRELQQRIAELEARLELDDVRIISSPQDEIPRFVTLPAAGDLRNRLALLDRTASSKNPQLVLSRRKTTGDYGWLGVTQDT